MDHTEVLLIGVFDPEGKDEGFVYSVDAPRNLWIGALCKDGSRMGHEFMAYVLNGLIEGDKFNSGDTFELFNQDGAPMIARVGDPIPARAVQAFKSETNYVLPVSVEVLDAG